MKNLLFFIGLFLMTGCAGIRARYHWVHEGESLPAVAKQYGISAGALASANPEAASKALKPNTKLFIPFESSPVFSARWEAVSLSENEPDQAPPVMARGSFIWPVHGFVSSPFGWRRTKHHDGIDIPARTGSPIRASRSGHVIYAGNRIPGYGNLVIIQHAGVYATVYGHMSKILVRKGQYVTKGHRIGSVGMTGHATSPHLHFEIRERRTPVNPLSHLPGQIARN